VDRATFVRRSLTPLLLGICLRLVLPAHALAQAVVRFIHALPGIGRVTVTVDQGASRLAFGSVAFAQSTEWRSIRAGAFRWLATSHGTVFQGNATVGTGAYDLVLLSRPPAGVTLGVYKASAGRPGTSLLRVIHAAPQLGAPALRLDARLLAAALSYTHATPYVSVNPGVHRLAALKPGTVAPLVSVPDLQLAAGQSYSAILVGSAGQRLRWVTVVDSGAPLTRPFIRPASKPAAAATGGASNVVTVEPGDSLWLIAARRLGPEATDEAIYQEVLAIWRLNARQLGTGDPNLIFPGQHVILPS
jgi:hypothetical protein